MGKSGVPVGGDAGSPEVILPLKTKNAGTKFLPGYVSKILFFLHELTAPGKTFSLRLGMYALRDPPKIYIGVMFIHGYACVHTGVWYVCSMRDSLCTSHSHRMGPRAPRHVVFLVLLALLPVLRSTDVLDHLRTRRLCENLDAQHAAGKGVPYNFHEEWAQYDCNFWATRDASGAETGTYVYRYLAYAALVQRMRALADVYPALVRLRTAQARYDLPTAGVCPGDAKGVEKTGCRVWILELGSEADAAEKPQVLLSGALHGNERIG